MTKKPLIGLLFVFALLAGCAPEPHPSTYADLVKAYRAAHRAKSIGGIDRLIYWGSMPQKDKDRILRGIAASFDKTISTAEIGDLESDFKMQSGTYIFPFQPEKTLRVSFENPGNKGGQLVGTEYSVGLKNGMAWILYRSEDVE